MRQPNDETSEYSALLDEQQIILIAELRELGIKHTPNQILRINKLPNGQIVFLEQGKNGKRGSGFKHILENHELEFRLRSILPEDLPDAIMIALSQGTIIGYQQPDRPIYEVNFQGRNQLIAITVSDNGYIVCANPGSLRPQYQLRGENHETKNQTNA